MYTPIKTPFDALVREVMGKLQEKTGIVYEVGDLIPIRIPGPANYFSSLEFYTESLTDDIRMQVNLQEGTDDSSSAPFLKNQEDFYCPKYSVNYPMYGDGTKVYTYVRTIRSSLVIKDILLLPSACDGALNYLITESGTPILTENQYYLFP